MTQPSTALIYLQTKITSRSTKVDTGYRTPCWISNRARHSNGYTKVGYGGHTWLTHRLAYVAFVGPIPEGLQIDHLCRQRACCNPWHLEAVTCRTNLIRGTGFVAQQVRRTHCPRGHPLSGANLYRRPGRRNDRGCRACRAEQARQSQARRSRSQGGTAA